MSETLNCIGTGSMVKLHFTIALEDGTVAVSTFNDQPVELIIGQGDLQEWLERALYGLNPGDSRTLRIPPERGFGLHDPQAQYVLARDEFPAQLPIEPGVIIEFTTPRGDEVAGLIKSVTDREVEVDFNHPLAGHEITFSVEILAVRNSLIGENAQFIR